MRRSKGDSLRLSLEFFSDVKGVFDVEVFPKMACGAVLKFFNRSDEF
jgi:hypothetical protein